MSTTELAVTYIPVNGDDSLALTPVMNIQTALARLAQFQEFIASYLVEGLDNDYGVIPGTKKKVLLKPGADKLCEVYGLADTYPSERIRRNERWDMEPPLFDYEVTCVLISKRNGKTVAEGMGSCNSYEGKYRYRDAQRECPNCGKNAIIKGKHEYGGGWLCFAKKGGCGSKFEDNDPLITDQRIGRIDNDDIAALKNTVLKMAKKRAKIDATLSATRSSGIFTQDIEEFPVNKPVHSGDIHSPQVEESQPPQPANDGLTDAQRTLRDRKAGKSAGDDNRTLNDSEVDQISAACVKNNTVAMAFLKALKTKWHVETASQLKVSQLPEVLRWVASGN